MLGRHFDHEAHGTLTVRRTQVARVDADRVQVRLVLQFDRKLEERLQDAHADLDPICRLNNHALTSLPHSPPRSTSTSGTTSSARTIVPT